MLLRGERGKGAGKGLERGNGDSRFTCLLFMRWFISVDGRERGSKIRWAAVEKMVLAQ